MQELHKGKESTQLQEMKTRLTLAPKKALADGTFAITEKSEDDSSEDESKIEDVDKEKLSSSCSSVDSNSTDYGLRHADEFLKVKHYEQSESDSFGSDSGVSEMDSSSD